jgi:hypothetical protein
MPSCSCKQQHAHALLVTRFCCFIVSWVINYAALHEIIALLQLSGLLLMKQLPVYRAQQQAQAALAPAQQPWASSRLQTEPAG